MKKRNLLKVAVMKKTLALALSVMMIVGALSIVSFADNTTNTESLGEAIWNEDMLNGKDLSSMFTVSTNSGTAGTVAYENGALKFTGTGGLDRFDLTGASLGLNTDVKNYTIVADVSFEGNLANNARFQLGFRPNSYAGSAKNHDWFAGIMQTKNTTNGTVKMSGHCNVANTGGGAGTLALTNAFTTEMVITYKIVVDGTRTAYYVSVDGGEWQQIGGSTLACGIEGEVNNLFFVVRTGHTVTVDNMVVYKGEESTSGDGGSTGGDSGETLVTTPVYYPSGTVIVNEDILKANVDKFDITYQNGKASGSAATSWNEETGRLVITGDTDANALYRYAPFPESLDYFTLTADLYLVSNEYGGNVLFQVGTRNPNMSWGQGNLIQLYVNYDTSDTTTKDKAQFVDKGAAGNTTGTVLELGTDIDIGTKVSVKIVVNDTVADYYVNDTWLYSIKVSKMGNSYGDLFFATRSKVAWEIDNLMVWSGVGEPSADKTILNTEPCAEKDVPVVETPDDGGSTTPPAEDENNNSETENNTQDTGTDTAADTTAAESDTDAATDDEGGCGSVIAAPIMLIVSAVAVPMAIKKRKE